MPLTYHDLVHFDSNFQLMKRLTYLVIAIAIAYWAQSYLAHDDVVLRDSLLLFAIAVALFIARAPRPADWPPPPPQRHWTKYGRILVVVSLVMVFIALVLFWIRSDRPDQFSGLPFWLWIFSMPLYLVGAWLDRQPSALLGAGSTAEEDASLVTPDQPDESESTTPDADPDAEGIWDPELARQQEAVSPLNRQWVHVLFLVIILFAAFVRFWQLDEFPYGCQSDECNNGIDAVQWLEGAPYVPYAETNEGQATLFTYLIAFSFRLFDVGVPQMRLVSAVMGVLAVAALYVLARYLFGGRIGLLAAGLMAGSLWHIWFSRIVYELIMVPLVTVLLVYFLLRALREGRLGWWALTGATFSLGLNTYTAFRVMPFLLAFFFLFWLLTHRNRLRADLTGLFAAGGGSLVVGAPLLIYILQNWSIFLGRARRISVFDDIQRVGSNEPLWDNLTKTLLMFNYEGDRAPLNNIPGEPLLPPLVGALFVLGLGYCLWHALRGRPLPLLFIAWFVVVGSVAVLSVAHEAPTARRPIGLVPLVYLLVSLVIYKLWTMYTTAWRGLGERYVSIGLAAMVAFTGIGSANDYFDAQRNDQSVWRAHSIHETLVGNFLAGLPEEVHAYVTSHYNHHSAVQLISQRPYQRFDPIQHLPLGEQPGGGVVYILARDQETILPLFQEFYPGGQAEFHEDKFGELMFLTYHVSGAELARVRGLRGAYFTGRDTTAPPALERQDTSLYFDWGQETPLPQPFTVTWDGKLLTRQQGMYRLEVEVGPRDRAVVQLEDNTLIDTRAESFVSDVSLVGGFHRLGISYQADRWEDARFALYWSGPGVSRQPISGEHLYAIEVPDNGLIGYYYANADWEGEPSLVQKDLVITAHPSMRAPFSIRWVGKIAAPQSGAYIFGTRSDDGSFLYINGELVVDNGLPGAVEYRENVINLEEGFHDIEILYFELGGAREMQLWWQPPGGVKQMIPLEYIFPVEDDAALADLELPPPPGIGVSPAVAVDLPAAAPVHITGLGSFGEPGAAPGQFNQPRNVAVDQEGRVYVADAQNARVQVFAPDGNFLELWDHNHAAFAEPFDVAVDAANRINVLDVGTQAVWQFSSRGELLGVVASDMGLYAPRGLSADLLGNIYIANTGGSRVIKLDSGDRSLATFGDQPGPEQLDQPTDVAVDLSGNLIVADTMNRRLVILSPEGQLLNAWPMAEANTLDAPHVDVDVSGRIYLTVPEQQRFLVYDQRGTLLADVPVGENSKPVGIAVSDAGRIYVTDAQQQRVHMFAIEE